MPKLLSTLLPHSPLLIDEIGKNNKESLKSTINAYDLIRGKIIENKIDSIIVISQQGEILDDSFSVGIAPEFQISFDQFACFKKRDKLKYDILLADQILDFISSDFSIQTRPVPKLDYGSAIPLELLTRENKAIKILPIYCANNLSWQEHYSFGLKLREFIINQEKNLAIIASGVLSHRLKMNSPGGYSPKGVKFDHKIIQYLNNSQTIKEKLLKLDQESVNEIKEAVIKPLLILLGIVGHDYQGKQLAYQDDFGVGYLSYLFN
jgi:MEMO1 family protein